MTDARQGPRHTTIDADARQASLQNSENARDTLDALAARPVQRLVTVALYTATGSSASRIRIGSGARPWSVVPHLIAQAYAQDSAVVCAPVLNFVWDSTTQSLDVFEPDGLTANTVYRLQYVITEASDGNR
jgi:hypothetical protein